MSRNEILGRTLGLLTLLPDEDLTAVYEQVQERLKRKSGGGTLHFQDPAQLSDMVTTGGLMSHAEASAKQASSPTEADQTTMVKFAFGGDDEAGGEEVALQDDDDDKTQTVTEMDASMNSRIASAYSGAIGRARRKTVSSEVINLEEIDHYSPPVYPKEKADEAFIRSVIRDEYLFEHLEDFELDVLIQAMFKQDVRAGDCLFTEGETGDTYKILQEGKVQISETHQDGQGHFVVGNYTAGWKRGEEDLMYAATQSQTVTVTSEKARVWCLQRQPFKFIVTKASIKKRAMYEEFLSKISFLAGMSNFARLQVADGLKPTLFQQGDKLTTFGDEGKYFFIVVEGTVKVIGREGDRADDPHKEVCEFGPGDCVGELEFVHGHRCVADVVAATPVVRCAKMGKRHFEKVMGPVEEVLKQRAAEDTKFAYYRGTGVASN